MAKQIVIEVEAIPLDRRELYKLALDKASNRLAEEAFDQHGKAALTAIAVDLGTRAEQTARRINSDPELHRMLKRVLVESAIEGVKRSPNLQEWVNEMLPAALAAAAAEAMPEIVSAFVAKLKGAIAK